MSEENALYNGLKVDALYRAIRNSQSSKLIPTLVSQIIEDDMWKSHTFEKTGETFHFANFRVFVETQPPGGLGCPLHDIYSFCVDDPVLIDNIDQKVEQTATADKDAKANKKPAVSHARQAGLRKLRLLAEKDEAIASLRQSVLNGTTTLNSALVEAGVRKKRVSIPRDTDKVAIALRRIYSADEIRKIASELTQ